MVYIPKQAISNPNPDQKLRDEIAIEAMKLFIKQNEGHVSYEKIISRIGITSYGVADAMLKERNINRGQN